MNTLYLPVGWFATLLYLSHECSSKFHMWINTCHVADKSHIYHSWWLAFLIIFYTFKNTVNTWKYILKDMNFNLYSRWPLCSLDTEATRVCGHEMRFNPTAVMYLFWGVQSREDDKRHGGLLLTNLVFIISFTQS